jgi:hypothetical protein
MRTHILSIAIALSALCSTASAAVPSEISIQGVLRSNAGQLQTMPVNLKIEFFDAATSGNSIAGPYTRTVAVTNGLFNVQLTDATLTTKLGGAPAVWVEVTVNSTDVFPRQKVTSEVFALLCRNADNADSLGGKQASDYLTIAAGDAKYVTQTAADSKYLTVSAAASTYQPKLTGGGCAPGRVVQSIAGDGTVTCAVDANSGGTVTNVTASPPLAVATGSTTPSISLNPIGTSFIADGAITGAKLGAAAVGTSALQDGAVTAAKLGAAAVGTTALQDSAVTGPKIAANTINGSKLASNGSHSHTIPNIWATDTTRTLDPAGTVSCAYCAAGWILTGGACNTVNASAILSTYLTVNGSQAGYCCFATGNPNLSGRTIQAQASCMNPSINPSSLP